MNLPARHYLSGRNSRIFNNFYTIGVNCYSIKGTISYKKYLYTQQFKYILTE